MLMYDMYAHQQIKVTAKLLEYRNGNTAIQVYTEEGEPYAIITVNFEDKLEPDMVYLDLNNVPNSVDFINRNGLGEYQGIVKKSGFCKYPLFKIYRDKFDK